MAADDASGDAGQLSAPVHVDIYWPAAVPRRADDVEQLLRDVGVGTTRLVRPVRRGAAELSVLVVVSTTAAQPFLAAVFGQLGGDAYARLRTFVHRLLHRGQDDDPAPTAVVFRSTATGAEFLFVPGLPQEAFVAAVAHRPEGYPGLSAWDPQARCWRRVAEPRTAAPDSPGPSSPRRPTTQGRP